MAKSVTDPMDWEGDDFRDDLSARKPASYNGTGRNSRSRVIGRIERSRLEGKVLRGSSCCGNYSAQSMERAEFSLLIRNDLFSCSCR